MSLKVRRIKGVHNRRLCRIKYDGLLCPQIENFRDFIGWRNAMEWRMFAVNSLINLIAPFSEHRFKVSDRFRISRCPTCRSEFITPVGDLAPTVCPTCGTALQEPLRLTVIVEENCKECGQPIIYDTMTLVGTCSCRRYDLIGTIVKHIQKAVRTDDAAFVKQLYRVLLEYHKGSARQHDDKGGDPNGESGSANQ